MRVTTFILIILLFALTTIASSARHLGYKVAYSGITVATAYNSMEWQCDSTPWITASGTRCREGVIATNALPFGTKVLIEGFGDQVFVVEDRMNRRYKKRIDIWMREYNDALKFGKRKIRYYVLKS
ncbi:MAG: 3D domain-containing protein [Candidatus Margulisiibacteriota bacterium]|nr:3D domain-containing protein [Candidatus Margulisiibacteriota bacterium]